MRTPEEIRHTPVLLLTEEEIGTLDADGQAYVRLCKANQARREACPGHERISTATRDQTRYGNHRGKCKHCDKDMSYDSGD